MTEPFRYAFSTTQSRATDRPGCWGSKYDNDARECRECEWQQSCRSEIVRLSVSRQGSTPTRAPPQPTTYANQMQPVQYAQPTFMTPPPPPQAQAATPVYRFNVAQPQQPQAPQQPQQQHAYRPPSPAGGPATTPAYVGWYGAVQDPAFGTIHAVPPPFRPQFSGESFGERVVKNMFLAATESILKEAVLGIRQVFLAPRTLPPVYEVVDVTPKR